VPLCFSTTANTPRHHNAPSLSLTRSRLALKMQASGRKPCAKALRRQAAGNGPMRVLANQVALHLEQFDSSIQSLPPALKKRRILPPPKPCNPPQPSSAPLGPRVAPQLHESTPHVIDQPQDDQEAFYPDEFDNPSIPSSATPLRNLGLLEDHDAMPNEGVMPSNTSQPWLFTAADDGDHLLGKVYLQWLKKVFTL
jgi:hypothetical protein